MVPLERSMEAPHHFLHPFHLQSSSVSFTTSFGNKVINSKLFTHELGLQREGKKMKSSIFSRWK